MKLIVKNAIALALSVIILIAPHTLEAQGLKDAFGKKSPLESVAGQAGVKDVDSVGKVSGSIINTALSLVGLIFLLLMVYGGYLWMTARGEDDQVQKAQTIIRNAIIGLILVLAAYAITKLVTTRLERGA